MASLFWVGGTGTYDGTTNHFATTSGGAATVALPTSSDTVTFDTLSNATAYTVTISALLSCSDLSIGAPLSGKITFAGSSGIDIYGSLAMPGGTAGITYSNTGTMNFRAVASGKTISTNGVTITSRITIGAASGGWTLSDALVCSSASSMSFTDGTFDTANFNMTITGQINTGAGTRTITLGTSTITCGGWVLTNGTTTLTATSSTISCSSTWDGAGKTYNIVTMTATSGGAFGGASTFTTLTFTGGANKSCQYSFSANQTITGTLTMNGNSITNRLFLISSVIGTARTLTAGTVVAQYTDFQDITGAGAGNWNLTAQSIDSFGDCLGNSGITFTTATTQHWTNASSGNWSASGNWTSRVPLPQDSVVMDKAFGTAQTVTADMPRMGKDIDWTGATWTISLTLSSSTSFEIFGSATFINGISRSGNSATVFKGRGSHTIRCGSTYQFRNVSIVSFGGTYTLGDDFTDISTMVFSTGTLDASTFNVNVLTFTASNVVGTLVLNMGSGTWTLSGTGTVWGANGITTVNCGTSTIKITDTSNTAVTFGVSGKTYNNVWFSRGASTGNITISGANTFNDFKDDGTAAHSQLWSAGVTTTFTTFSVSGNGAGNEITINSTTTAAFTFTAPSRNNASPISRDYLNIQHCIATQANTWYAGTHSVNNQATATAGSGWIFTDTVLISSYNGGFFRLL